MAKRGRKSTTMESPKNMKRMSLEEEPRSSEEWVAAPPPPAENVLHDVMCPWCFRKDVMEPVLIHQSTGSCCVACKTCVGQLHSLLCFSKIPYACPQCEVKCTVENVKVNDVYDPDLHGATRNVSFSSETKGAPEEVQCGMCEEKTASLKCFQCNFCFCQDCHTSTHSKGLFKTHEVVSLDAARRAESKMCGEHPDKSLDLYCKDCSLCVCVSCCFAGSHKGHDVTPLSDVAVSARSSLQSMAAELHAFSERSGRVTDHIEEAIPQYNSIVNSVESDIRSTFASLIKQLQQREEFLVGQLKTASVTLESELAGIKEISATLAESLTNNFHTLDGIASELHPVTLMKTLGRIEDCCRQVKQQSSGALRELEVNDRAIQSKIKMQDTLAKFSLLPNVQDNLMAAVQYNDTLSSLGNVRSVTTLKEDMVDTPAKSSERESEGPNGEEEAYFRYDEKPTLQGFSALPTPSEYRFSNNLELRTGDLRRTEVHHVDRVPSMGLKLNLFDDPAEDAKVDYLPSNRWSQPTFETVQKHTDILAQPKYHSGSEVNEDADAMGFSSLKLRL